MIFSESGDVTNAMSSCPSSNSLLDKLQKEKNESNSNINNNNNDNKKKKKREEKEKLKR